MLASQDRKSIREYIAEQNLMAAIELDERIGYSASSLAGQPYKGRNGRVEGTRELVIHPHFVRCNHSFNSILLTWENPFSKRTPYYRGLRSPLPFTLDYANDNYYRYCLYGDGIESNG